jgi:lipoprotein-releasing system permease protein
MLRSTGLAALLATSLGVTAMVIAMALMTGYTEDLERKLIGLQGEVIASPLGRRGLDHDDVQRRLRAAAAVPGVVRAGRVAYGEGALASAAVPEGLGVVLRGVAPDDPIVARHGGEIGSDEEGIPGALLGAELARRLEVASGDLLRLVILDLGERRPRFRYRSIRVTGTFASGFAEFDARWILIDREVLLAAGGSGFEMVEFKIADPRATEDVARALEEALGTDWVVERWQRLNRDLFAALELQKLGLFAVLALIVLVSTFNVASTLVILVRERRRDVGVLGALGLTARDLGWSFATYGLLLGAVGTALGILAGGGVAWLVTEFELVRFDPEIAAVYFIDSVPFRVRPQDLAAICAFTLGVTLAACSLPAWRAAGIRPAAALRDE